MREAIKDYFSGKEWQDFIRNISTLLNISFCNFVISYNEKIHSFSNENPLCLKLREKEKGLKFCQEVYEKNLKEIEGEKKARLFLCYASLGRVLIPIPFDSDKVVFIMCGIRYKRNPKANWEKLNEIIGKEEFLKLYKSLPFITLKKLKLNMDSIDFLLKKIIDLLVLKEKLKDMI